MDQPGMPLGKKQLADQLKTIYQKSLMLTPFLDRYGLTVKRWRRRYPNWQCACRNGPAALVPALPLQPGCGAGPKPPAGGVGAAGRPAVGTDARRLSGAGSSTTLRITGSPRRTVRIS